MELDGAISPIEALWLFRPFSLALDATRWSVNPPAPRDNVSSFSMPSVLHPDYDAPYSASLLKAPHPHHRTEQAILTVMANIIPASLVLLYILWSCAPFQKFVLDLPGISFLHHATRPFVSFEDAVASLHSEKESAIADEDDEDEEETVVPSSLLHNGGTEVGEATPLLLRARKPTLSHWPDPGVTISLCLAGFGHLGVLVGHFCFIVASRRWGAGQEPLAEVVTDLVLDAAGWIYVLVRTLFRPQATPPYDTFVLLLVFLSSSVVRLHLALISWYDGSHLYTAPSVYAGAASASSALCIYALTMLVNMPLTVLSPHLQSVLGYPSAKEALNAPANQTADASKLSCPEAFCTLWQWMSFRWVDSLLQASNKGKVSNEDVWSLAADLKARILDRKWNQIKGLGVAKRVWLMNSRDLLIDFFLTLVATVNAYAKPLVLKRVLEGIESGQRDNENRLTASEVWTALVKGGQNTSRETAYVIAALGLILVAVGSQADLYHLYAGRRCMVRTRSELISALFAKGLRCKDIGGAVTAAGGDRSTKEEPEDPRSPTLGEARSNKSNTQNPRNAKATENTQGTNTPTSADASSDQVSSKDKVEMKAAEKGQNDQGIGKAVSLMSVDVNAIGMFLSMLFMLYGAPLDLIICLSMLYSQLGPSAFVGFAVVPIVIPLQAVVVRYMMQLFKKVGNVRDSRMSALSEVVSNLRLLKLINWEGKLNERVIKLRNQELHLSFLRSLVTSLMGLIWSLAPAAISVIGFASFTLFYKEPLTVPVAFTALNLYQQLTRPLGVLPMMLNHTVTVAVSAGRIQRFLEYSEVPENVSTLHRFLTSASMPLSNNVTASNATFRWHSLDSLDEAEKAEKSQSSPLRKAISKAMFWRKDAPVNASIAAETDSHTSSVSSSDPDSGMFTLHDITLTVDEGLTLVCGPTGSGKSSLLSGLLGEMDVLSGKLTLDKQPGVTDPRTGLHGGISFCAQQPWLQQKSVRENILFGESMDMERYKAVLEVCALMPDIELFDDGDLQEIGESGISLSGGQKARVALARAVYSRARTVLLDDVLSAVDAHTAQKLVADCLTGPLMKNRCIVLVTHQVELVLPQAHRIVKLEKGIVTAMGPASDLVASGAIVALSVSDPDSPMDGKGKGKPTRSSSSSEPGNAGNSSHSSNATRNAKIAPLDGSKATHNIVEKEKLGVGRVKSQVYGVYLQALGWYMIALVGLTLIITNATGLGASVWLSYWSSGGSQCESPSSTNLLSNTPATALTTAGMVYHSGWTPFLVKLLLRPFLTLQQININVAQNYCWLPPAATSPLPYMLIFALIEFMRCVFTVVTNIVMFVASLHASRKLFARMLESVSHSTARWLDKTPSGQILNRFGKDIESLDSGLIQSASMVLFQVFSLLTALATLAVLLPTFIIPALGVIWLYYMLSKVYVACSRDLRRLESAHRSPIFSGYSEALKGIATIRAFSAETRLLHEVYDKVDAFSSAHYFWWMTNRWLMLRVELVGGLSIFGTQILALSGTMSSGTSAVAITQAANFTMSLYWLCRGWANLEQELTSIERVVDYLPPKIPQEPPQYIEGAEAPAAWPSRQATIKFDDVWLRYDASFDPVLKGVSFEIRPGEKVGIVGRTGSGKSTCASSLLRFADPEKGSISIEGIDIRTLGLHDLRSRISFIPQDPVLFKGTVRDNLDPFNEHTDDQCHLALSQVRLSRSPDASQADSRAPSRPPSVHGSDAANTPPSGAELSSSTSATAVVEDEINDLTISSPVADSGGNLSQGQKQLLAMARALLSHNHIVIADEATASVDFAADRAIQQVIRDRFKDNIMLVIAHRLTTIAEFSRVLVLDAGKVVEFDTPAKLLAKKDGYFYRMAQHSGVYDALVRMAKADSQRQ